MLYCRSSSESPTTLEERVSRAVSVDEIRENDHNLNIALYVDTTEPEEEIDVREELATLRELQAERDEIIGRISKTENCCRCSRSCSTWEQRRHQGMA